MFFLFQFFWCCMFNLLFHVFFAVCFFLGCLVGLIYWVGFGVFVFWVCFWFWLVDVLMCCLPSR